MLTLYRRHLRACPHRSMTYKRCRCPVWVVGTLDGEFMRRSLSTVSWGRATDVVREWERSGAQSQSLSVSQASDRFLEDCAARHLAAPTIRKYTLLVKELKAEFGDVPVGSLAVEDLDAYRKTWNMAASSSRKKLERLRAFLGFCLGREWIRQNPAKSLKPPRVPLKPTLPFSPAEMEDILWATDVYRDDYNRCPREYARRLKPFVLVLRYTGLRIGDAVALEADRIHDGKLLLYTQKTGVPVYIPLPEDVLVALETIREGRYFFWSGNGDKESAVKNWQRTLQQLFKVAGVKGHAHQFRDTFAVSLLTAAVSIETVAVLLGHESVQTTEKHYAPWVHSRQLALEAAVKAAWK